MKPFFFILASLCFSVAAVSNAQTVFAPAGSEWYHTMHRGVFHSYNNGDTTIVGKPCRKIRRSAQYVSYGPPVDDLTTLYVYNTADTVFVYNSYYSQFTPLYVFNVNDGDTVHLPILPDDIGMLTTSFADSTFSFRVDSVRMKLYDTAMLKTVFIHSLGDPFSNYIFNYGDTVDAYAERLGALDIALMPFGGPAVIPLTESAQLGGSIRCYHDPSISVKLVPQACDYPLELMQAYGAPVSIFPNPATSEITVYTNASVYTSLTVTNVLGQEIVTETIAQGETRMGIDNFAPGLYYISLKKASGEMLTQKFVKM